MTKARAEMWQSYSFRGYDVTVVQQWEDPYGRWMVRIQTKDDGDRAEGLPEGDFLREAIRFADASFSDRQI